MTKAMTDILPERPARSKPKPEVVPSEVRLERIESTRSAESAARLRSLAPHFTALVDGIMLEIQENPATTSELKECLGLRDTRTVGALRALLEAQSGRKLHDIPAGDGQRTRLYGLDLVTLRKRATQVRGELADIEAIAEMFLRGPVRREDILPFIGDQDLLQTLRRVETWLTRDKGRRTYIRKCVNAGGERCFRILR